MKKNPANSPILIILGALLIAMIVMFSDSTKTKTTPATKKAAVSIPDRTNSPATNNMNR